MERETYREMSRDEHARELAARSLHWRTTVVLGYNNIPLRPTRDGFDPASILGKNTLCATSVERLVLGGVKAIVWSPGIAYWDPTGRGMGGREKARFIQQQLETMHQLPELTGGLLQIALNAADIRRINAEGTIAVVLHISGANHLNDLGVLRSYYDLGVRGIHGGFQDWPEDAASLDSVQYDDPHRRNYHPGRMNEHGVRTVEEMKRLGMVVDVAHLNGEGFDHVADLMEGTPFVYSHGGCAALDPNERTFDDARIRRLADGGGVYGIGVCLGPSAGAGPAPPMHGEDPAARVRAATAEGRKRREEEMLARAKDVREYICLRYGEWGNWEIRELARLKGFVVPLSIRHVVAHMAHLREAFGPQVVGYGPDYEHTYGYVRGLEEADKTPNLTRALLEERWPEADVQGAMGHNFMRVFEAVMG